MQVKADKLTCGAGGRIKEAEEQVVDEYFKKPGESSTTARLRAQEEIYQKASAILSDEVSTIVLWC